MRVQRNTALKPQRMSRFGIDELIRPELRRLAAYQVHDATGLIKLDAMENPYGWPPEMVHDWLDTLREVPLNRYPDADAAALKRALRSAMNIPDDLELLLGNGSDELIQMLMLATAQAGRVVLAPEPSFSMYRQISLGIGLDFVGVPLRADDFALDAAAMRAALEQYRPGLVFIAYPNNPTGNLFADAAIRDVIANAPGLVIIDEAYLPFAQATLMQELEQWPHVLILRTLSKLGLAGLRLGLLIGGAQWLTQIEKIRLPYNINVLTQASALFALAHTEVLEEQACRVRAGRESLFQALSVLPGIMPYPSRGNFILFRAPSGQAEAIFMRLKQSGVLIKNLHGAGALLTDCLRVTVGTPEENRAFLTALTSACAELC